MRTRLTRWMMTLGVLALASLLAVAYAPAQPRRGPPPATGLQSGIGDLCDGLRAGLSFSDADRIEKALALTEDQSAKFKSLKEATDKALQYLQDNCPADNPVTPPARAAATEQQLQAMLEAVRTVRPALDDFYRSLTDEQKARFSTIAPAKNGGRPVDNPVRPTHTKPVRHQRNHYGWPFRWLFRF
jgi:hypothetical protein